MSKNLALRAWTDMNSLLRTHKLINFGLIIVCALQTAIIGMMYFDDPIVVIQNDSEERYVVGHKASIPISEPVVEDFVKSFLKVRYEWTDLDPKAMRKSLSPIVTEGLNHKLFELLIHLRDKEFQGKKTSQAIVNVKVNVTQDKVVASFDKLLRIEGIPIPVPTTVSLNIIRDTPNEWNPVGLLVNGIIEHQSK